jgi:tripartite-type tricarboxylate transporter receptor subunit TctC
MLRLLAVATILLFRTGFAVGAEEDVAQFYRGRTVTCLIGYGVGGAYDFYARQISKYLARHIPGNPRVVPENMPGASSMVLGNHLARRAPRDGSVFGIVNSALIFDPLFAGAQSKAQFEGPEMTMIGNAVSAAAVLISSKASGVRSFDELRSKDLVIGAMTRTGDTYVLPLAMKRILNLDRLQIVTGYPGSREVLIALERGEVSGRVWDMEGLRAVRPAWLRDGSVNVLVQLASQRMPEVPPSVPLLRDFIHNEEDNKVLDVIFLTTLLARPFIAPPGIPVDRVRALRQAFLATLQDPDFLAEMAKAKVDVAPISGEEMEQHVRTAYALPDAIVQKVRKALAD